MELYIIFSWTSSVSHHKSAARPDPAAQEREKLLTTLQEEASIAKDKVKQLSQVWLPMFYHISYKLIDSFPNEPLDFWNNHLFQWQDMASCYCAIGASGWKTKDWPRGSHDERATCSHGERAREHAGESTGQLPGTPDHANKGDSFISNTTARVCYVELDGTIYHQS